ncbi:glycosyltransferase [Pseudohoeflea coraliihabitans]|uniref:Glycosyltransferase n=1 Tax=Pseudohoeflea coraliihabitans TaxID=2860393 RepID=A0ABS6WLR0_9HYPH|nr:glycosyltransferase [Pseudohoeflea sp. DP4N28-3]MBW3096896.1 glycosyltransferase [Pseudohoeflea sp. DP4N28-3]
MDSGGTHIPAGDCGADEGPGGDQPRTCVLVLGMHRSGTSLLTRTIGALGAALPRTLSGDGPGNETGHWEPQRIVEFNDELLAEIGSAWHDWQPLPLLTDEYRSQLVTQIQGLITDEYGGHPVFVLKDPRICRFADLYLDACNDLGIKSMPIIPFRNPLEVADSLRARSQNWPETYGEADAILLWLTHVLDAEHSTRGRQRTFVPYSGLLEDWRSTVSRMDSRGELPIDVDMDAAAPLLDAFVSKKLRHHWREDEEIATSHHYQGWVGEVYDALRALSGDSADPGALATFDDVRDQLSRTLPILSALRRDRYRFIATAPVPGEAEGDAENRPLSQAARDEAGSHEQRDQRRRMALQTAKMQEELQSRRQQLDGARLALGVDKSDERALSEIITSKNQQWQTKEADNEMALKAANQRLAKVRLELSNAQNEAKHQADIAQMLTELRPRLDEVVLRLTATEGALEEKGREFNSLVKLHSMVAEREAELKAQLRTVEEELNDREQLIVELEERLTKEKEEAERIETCFEEERKKNRVIEEQVKDSQEKLEILQSELLAEHADLDGYEESRNEVFALTREMEEKDESLQKLNDKVTLLTSELAAVVQELNRERRTILKPAYRRIYSGVGRLLRFFLSDDAVSRLRRRVPNPEGIPRHLTDVTPGLPVTTAPQRNFHASPALAAPDIFVFSIINWDFRTQRPQHIARALAKTHRVFYVEMTMEQDEASLVEISENLYRIRLGARKAGHIHPYTGRPATLQAQRWVEEFLNVCDRLYPTAFKHVIIQHPFWWQLARHLPPEFSVLFDCMDDIAGFSNTKPFLLQLERDLIEQCDRMVVSSQYLLEKYSAVKAPTMIRNAGEIDHFTHDEANEALPLFLEQAGFERHPGKIHIGYVGAIAEWYDTELLLRVATDHPEFLFHLCGSVTASSALKLGELSNVTLHGEIPYAQVPAFIRQMDVMIIPFKLLPIIQACDPVKFYEYSAMGKPTVATRMPELERAEHLVYFASDAAEFGQQISNAAAAGRDPDIQEKLREFAAQNTWDSRGEQFETVLETYPKVSVIILSYGDTAWTKGALFSLFDGGPTYPDMEVLVVDNGSSEEALEELRSECARYTDARVIANGTNLGFAAGNNVGLREASGEFVMLLNNDTYVAAGAVHAMVRHLQRNPSIGAVGPLTNNIGNEAKLDVEYADISEMKRVARASTTGYRGLFSSLRVVAYFAVMFRRADLDRFGLLSEDYGRGMFEDDDHCAVIRSQDMICALAEDAFVHHHLSATFNTIESDERRAMFEENKAIFERRWGPWTPHRYRKARPPSTFDNVSRRRKAARNKSS